jgi:23S rRNA (guanosine2251-2'-O)-methyltransferase
MNHAGGTGSADREVVCGRQPVRELLIASRRKIYSLYLAAQDSRDRSMDEIRALAVRTGVRVTSCDQRAVDRLAGTAHHQGVAVEVSPYPAMDMPDLLAMLRNRVNPVVLLLDHIQDPQNLGALLRTAESAAVDAVVIPRRRAAAVTPAAVRASSGAAEHVKTAAVANIGEVIRRLKDAGFRIAGLDMSPESVLYHEADLSGPLGLVIGAEGQGLQRLVRESCDFLVRIPQLGRVGSMNAAAAGAVVVFEAVRQRDPAGIAPQQRGRPRDPAPRDTGIPDSRRTRQQGSQMSVSQ